MGEVGAAAAVAALGAASCQRSSQRLFRSGLAVDRNTRCARNVWEGRDGRRDWTDCLTPPREEAEEVCVWKEEEKKEERPVRLVPRKDTQAAATGRSHKKKRAAARSANHLRARAVGDHIVAFTF